MSMPSANQIPAYIAIGLQIIAAIKLLRKPQHFPAMLTMTLAILASITAWYVGQGWTVCAWISSVCKLAVACECVYIMKMHWHDQRNHVLACVFAGVAMALAALASDHQPSLIYSVRYMVHCACAGACLCAWLLSRRIAILGRTQCAIATLYFAGCGMADIGQWVDERSMWRVHLALAYVQMAAWFAWVVLFNALPAAETHRYDPQSGRSVGSGAQTHS